MNVREIDLVYPFLLLTSTRVLRLRSNGWDARSESPFLGSEMAVVVAVVAGEVAVAVAVDMAVTSARVATGCI